MASDTTQTKIVASIAKELGVGSHQVAAAVALLDEGSTVPFIRRPNEHMACAGNASLNLVDAWRYDPCLAAGTPGCGGADTASQRHTGVTASCPAAMSAGRS